MRRLCMVALLTMVGALRLFADTQDTAVFRTRMLPDNEVPPIAAAGNSAGATITVHVTRDARGNVNAATVTFDIDYTVTSAVTFSGLHIHNAPVAQNGPVVIDTGISGANPLNAAAGSGKITRVVNYDSSATQLRFVTGLLAAPELYYVNIHTTTNGSGFMRGQLQASRLVFRPLMSTDQEVAATPVTADAEGAAMIEVQVTRDPQTAAITSGTVTFDVDYRFGSAVTISGLHIHNAAAGANGPIVFDTGVNGTSTAIALAGATRGNVFRVVEIPNTNTAGIAQLTALFADPTQFYVNMHTTVNPGGVIRGQLSKTAYTFFNLMTQAEENPPTAVTGTANSMTTARVDRDASGNITSGSVRFNVAYNMGSAQTFTGLHIHNGRIGVNGGVVINTGLSAANTVATNASGTGDPIIRDVAIASTDASLESLRGLIESPESYYVNIHSVQFGGGIVRSQLVKETYHFKTAMTTANEVPPVTGVDTAATGWVTAAVTRDANGTLTGGTVTFDVNFTNTGAITFTGLHIHHPAPAGVNAGVAINTGINATNNVQSTTGNGNITRVVTVDPANATAMAALSALITAPDTAYINLHSTQFGGGVVRSQILPVVNTFAQVAGGLEWLTAVTITNPSATASVEGVVDFFNRDRTLMPAAVIDPNISFWIPASGSVTLSTHNKGALAAGYAKVFSNAPVNVEARYTHSAFTPNTTAATTVTGRSVVFPVSVSATGNTGIALIAESATSLTLTLRSSGGISFPLATIVVDVAAGQQIAQFASELLPKSLGTVFSGSLTISASTGNVSVVALQFDGSVTPVPVSVQ